VKVLVLEDDELVAQGLVRGLGYLGCVGVHVSEVNRARQLVDDDREIGLALIDLGLAEGQSGEDFLEWIRQRHPGICRVLISGTGRPTGFCDDPPRQLFLLKPFGLGELSKLLETVQPLKATGAR
jgi:DNA-binding NtrC family response regulator